MTRTIIRKTEVPRASTRDAYARYFRDLTAEYLARSQRLERRLLTGGTSKNSPDMIVLEKPTWELDDVCCFTNITQGELQQVLPPLFDAFRRLNRARFAAMSARHVKRSERLELAALGVDIMIAGLLERLHPERADYENVAEEIIDSWLEPMFGPCRWSEFDHFGHRCRKPVDWTHADMGGGHSVRSARWDQ